MEKNELFAMIQNPAPQYRGKPFWSWNGKLEKNELLAQIDVMREMGFGGFFIHSRRAWKFGFTTRTVGLRAPAAAR